MLRALVCDPLGVVRDDALDLLLGHEHRRGQRDRLSPGNGQGPALDAARAAHLHELVHMNEAKEGFGRLLALYAEYFLMTMHELWPPKPNELLTAYSTSALRAAFGT